MRRSGMAMDERFWSHVDKSAACWEWTAGKTSNGYGAFTESKGRSHRAHRLAYELTIGPIPEGMVLDHICRNTTCVKPDHLRPVTKKQNGEHRGGATRRSSTGVLGVAYRKDRGFYTARVGHNGKEVHGGQFETLEEAAEAVKHLRLRLFTHNEIDRKAA